MAAEGRRAILRSAVIVGAAALVAGLWLVLRDPAAEPSVFAIDGCNGHQRLCQLRVDEVSFAAAHNAMSNTEISDWMFPHHEASIVNQLRAGVRALLIDVHYGIAGASRIVTDLDGERPSAEKLEHALGEEGVEAALRIRQNLIGRADGGRGLYLCHGFCEIGAYELTPTLAGIHEFLVHNPGEVIVIVVEDYVTPADLAAAFEESGLAGRVYRGPSGPPWPTLGELVAGGDNVIAFLESGHGGVDWLRPAFEVIQETPYSFHSPEELSCRANRGGTAGSLFQINHWIETTPTPLPSNAAIVNARDVLLARARACESERGMLPNIVAVDFFRTGDLLDVVDDLNGVGRLPSGAPSRPLAVR